MRQWLPQTALACVAPPLMKRKVAKQQQAQLRAST